ncbi:MAG: hypothetical protein JRH20_31560 [Deltaproteobacteria bacterium]|nr:hypothetical protein [Deltaproteobacteria bacterium]
MRNVSLLLSVLSLLCSSAALADVTPASAPAGTGGSLAVVNLGRRGAFGWLQARRAQRLLERYVGGWAETPSVAAALVGDPAPRVLPEADVGRQLGVLLEELRRPGRPSLGALFRLGRALGVNYLLLMRIHGGATSSPSLSARIFSVHRQDYAPQGFEREDDRLSGLESYIKHQIRGRKRAGGIKRERWWVWAIGGAVVVATLVLSALSESDDEGTLTVRIRR